MKISVAPGQQHITQLDEIKKFSIIQVTLNHSVMVLAVSLAKQSHVWPFTHVVALVRQECPALCETLVPFKNSRARHNIITVHLL
jgi:hypothetical protein